MDILQIAIFIVLAYVCVYGIVNRICKAIENCAMARCVSCLSQLNHEELEKVISGFRAANKTEK